MVRSGSEAAVCGLRGRRRHRVRGQRWWWRLWGRRGLWAARPARSECGSQSRRGPAALLRTQRGQMAVEMAVVMPVLLAVVGIAINLMVYLGDCARFDRVAAEAVRTQASSPGFGEYGTVSRAEDVQAQIEQSFTESGYLSFSVEAWENGFGGGGSGAAGEGVGFSLLPHQETYVCTMSYRPWGFGESFFGIRFSGIPHARTYVIDPYRPGVLL